MVAFYLFIKTLTCKANNRIFICKCISIEQLINLSRIHIEPIIWETFNFDAKNKLTINALNSSIATISCIFWCTTKNIAYYRNFIYFLATSPFIALFCCLIQPIIRIFCLKNNASPMLDIYSNWHI